MYFTIADMLIKIVLLLLFCTISQAYQSHGGGACPNFRPISAIKLCTSTDNCEPGFDCCLFADGRFCTLTNPDICFHNGLMINREKTITLDDNCSICECRGYNDLLCNNDACVWPTPSRPPATNCQVDGKIYELGDTFLSSDGCNTCICGSDGAVGCTYKICLPEKHTKCNHKGQTYTSGEAFTDNCNTCICNTDGSVKCTDIPCPNGKKTCSHKGKEYKEDEFFKIDCNTCRCGPNGVADCTNFTCTPKYQKSCTYKEKQYAAGETFRDECNACTCDFNGLVQCNNNNDYCQKKCMYKFQEYSIGQQFQEDCNTCICKSSGKVECTTNNCQTTGCVFNGQNYRFGQNFDYGCKQCTCRNDANVNCNTNQCFGTCKFNGNTYDAGQDFDDGCKTCTCANFGIVQCNNDQRSYGQVNISTPVPANRIFHFRKHRRGQL